MAKAPHAQSMIEQLVVEHVRGSGPVEAILNTPQTRAAYWQRMEDATSAGYAEDQKAREESWTEAQTRTLG